MKTLIKISMMLGIFMSSAFALELNKAESDKGLFKNRFIDIKPNSEVVGQVDSENLQKTKIGLVESIIIPNTDSIEQYDFEINKDNPRVLDMYNWINKGFAFNALSDSYNWIIYVCTPKYMIQHGTCIKPTK
jgi:hypothetical protein